ncbi:MAG: DUF177 domain-containing protein [Eubacteriales bacterium]
MIINLLSVVAVDDNTVQNTVSFESDFIEHTLGSFRVVEKSDFVLTIKHIKDNQVLLSGETEFKVEIPCDRCLKPTEKSISITIDKDIKLNELDDDIRMIEEKNYIDGYNLDVDKVLLCEILIGWPMKILCCDNCEGVCNVCGQNLNEGTCSCEDTGIDPRMSVIRDVFKNFKEV